MKKILSIIVALAMILALVPVSIGVTSAAAGDTYELVTSEPSDWSGTYLWVYHPTTAANGGTTRINKDWAAHFNSTTGANFSAVMEVFPSAGSIPWSSGVAAAEITVTKSDTTGRYHLQRADGYYLGMQGTTSMLASNTKQTVANYQWFFEWNNGSPNAGTDGSGTRRLTWNYNGDNPRCSGYAPSASYISPKLYKFTLAGGSSGDNPYTVHVYGMDGGSVSKIVGDGVDATLGEQVNGWKSAAFTGADVQEVELTGTFNGTGDLTAFGRKLVLTPEFPVAYIFSWGRAGNNTAYATVYAKDNGNGTVTFSVLGYHDSPYSISSNQIGWNTEAPPATPSYNDGFAALTSGALDSKLVPADEDGQWLRLWSGTFPYTAGDFLNEFKIYRWGDVVFPDGEGNGAPLSVSALPCSDGHDGDEVPNPAKPAVVGDCLNEAWSAGTMCSLCGEEITPPIKGSLNPAICACAPGHDCGDTCGCACCAPKTEQDFALTTNLIPGTYVVAAYNNDVTVGVGAITAAYGTPNANWLTSRTVKPSANTVTTGDAEIIWELTGDSTNGFSMYNAANDVWLTIATGTSNPAANISAKGLTNATKPATATFDIFVSTFTSSNPNSFRISSRGTPANVLKLNWGAGYGFRMYADSNAPTGINGTQPTILFYKLVQEECVTHTWGDWGAKVPSTCSTLGVDNRVCSVCSAEQTREALALSTVAPINHAGEGTYYVGGFPAVGITPGYEGDIHCSGCNAKIGEGDPIAPGYQGTFVVITDASDVEAGDKIIVLVNRASGNYWYLAGEPSDSRILAVQDGPATAPTSITNPKYAYVFEVEEAGDNLAIKAVGGSQAGKYITWTAGNVASYGGSAYELKIVDGATTGTWRIQSAADATRYLALNNSAGNDYFAFYTGTTVRLNLTILKLETDNPCAGGHIGEEIDDPENPAVGGTCTTNAYSKGTKWSCCGAVAVAKAEIPDSKVPSNHTGAVIDDPENPAVGGTCTTNAYAKGTKWSCCNVVVQAKAEIPDSKVPSNHTGAVIDDPDNPAVAGTCTTNAYSKGTKWSCCNVIAAAKAEIPDSKVPSSHTGAVIDDPDNPAVAGTCTTNAYAKGTKWSCCNVVVQAKAEIPDSKVPSNHTGAVIDDPDNPAVRGTCLTNAWSQGTKWSCCGVVVAVKSEIPDSKDSTNCDCAPECDCEGERCDCPCCVCPHDGAKSAIAAAVTATCVADGWTAGLKCDLCGYVITARENLGKNPGNHMGAEIPDPDNPAQAGDCVTNSWSAGTIWSCCGEVHTASEEGGLNPSVHIGNKIADPAHPAVGGTCTTPGTTAGTLCDECDQAWDAPGTGTTDAANHGTHKVNVINAVSPDCGNAGYSGDKQCDGCKAIIETGTPIGKVPGNHGTYGTEKVGEVAAQIGKAGYTGDTVCKGCGVVLAYGVEIPPLNDILWGDADENGVVNAADAAAILRCLVQLRDLTPQGKINAKVTLPLTADISAADAAKILRWLVQLVPELDPTK